MGSGKKRRKVIGRDERVIQRCTEERGKKEERWRRRKRRYEWKDVLWKGNGEVWKGRGIEQSNRYTEGKFITENNGMEEERGADKNERAKLNREEKVKGRAKRKKVNKVGK